MLAAYLAAAAAGGLLVLAGALLGGDANHPSDVEHAGDADGAAGHADGGNHSHWPAVLSLRFWSNACGAFGLTGALLTWLGGTGAATTAAVAVATGVAAGGVVTWLYGYLRGTQVTSTAATGDLTGAPGRVLVAPAGSEDVKVRLEIQGEFIDVAAVAHGGQALAAGAEVVVIDYDGPHQRVVVADRSRVLPPPGSTVREREG